MCRCAGSRRSGASRLKRRFRKVGSVIVKEAGGALKAVFAVVEMERLTRATPDLQGMARLDARVHHMSE